MSKPQVLSTVHKWRSEASLDELRRAHQHNLLRAMAKSIAQRARVLCFDEIQMPDPASVSSHVQFMLDDSPPPCEGVCFVCVLCVLCVCFACALCVLCVCFVCVCVRARVSVQRPSPDVTFIIFCVYRVAHIVDSWNERTNQPTNQRTNERTNDTL